MTRTKAEQIEIMIMRELSRDSLSELLDYYDIQLCELEQFMERAKVDLLNEEDLPIEGCLACKKARIKGGNCHSMHDYPSCFEKSTGEEWHNLKLRPYDLPERMGLGSVEVYVAYEGGVTDFACYRFDKKCWERSEDEEEAVNVIAWREIPLFKESE